MTDDPLVLGLVVPASVWERALRHLIACAPCEGVGLLGGRNEQGWLRGDAFYPGTNVDASPTRYTMDPAEVLAALRDMEANGRDLVGIVHSHPRTAPVPSATDLTEAYYPDAVLVIAGFRSDEPAVRCWRVGRAHGDGASDVAEVPLVVEGERRSAAGVDEGERHVPERGPAR